MGIQHRPLDLKTLYSRSLRTNFYRIFIEDEMEVTFKETEKEEQTEGPRLPL